MNSKVRLSKLACYLCSFHLLVGPADGAIPIDEIVAVVNGDCVLRSELQRDTRRIAEDLRQRGGSPPSPSGLKQQVLERLVLKKIQLQVALRAGLQVDDATLNKAVNNIAADNGLSILQFRNILERDGYNFNQFKRDVRDEILITKLRQREIDERIQITDIEIDDFLATQQQQGGKESEYHLAHILVAFPDGADDKQVDETRKDAAEALARLRGGADFQQTALSASDGQQALEGGDLGWRTVANLPSLFADKVDELKRGEISELIQSPSGFHIIKLMDVRRDETHMIKQTKARHILIKPNELVSKQDAKTRLSQLRLRLLGGENFAELARSHSDDRASSANGGELGWVNAGDLVPRFEEVMNHLQAGDISQPFETEFGWHIVQVLERRDYDGTEEIRRADAKATIRKRKIEEEHEIWLRRLRDEAYVEYRIDSE
ncbi:MAG: peptidylprolyl isomerase [Gammaproteobacteria bacterium]